MAQGDLRFAERAGEVAVQAEEREVVDGGFDVGGAEVARVEANHAGEVDLGLFTGRVGEELGVGDLEVGDAQEAVVVEGDSEVDGGDVVVGVEIGYRLLEETAEDLEVEEDAVAARSIGPFLEVSSADLSDVLLNTLESKDFRSDFFDPVYFSGQGELKPSPVFNTGGNSCKARNTHIAPADDLVTRHAVRIERPLDCIAIPLPVFDVDAILDLASQSSVGASGVSSDECDEVAVQGLKGLAIF